MNVLITGASTGIGEACARWLERRGHLVFAGVRRDADAMRLREGASERLRPITIDVTEGSSIEQARLEVERGVGSGGLHALVNNAGVAIAGPLEHVPVDVFRRQLDVNVTGQIAVTQAFLGLLRPVRGRIVFMGSIGGRMATPFLGPYCASKFALEAVSDCLRVELQPWRMHVILIEPGSIATPIWSKSEAEASHVLATADTNGDYQRHYGVAMEAVRRAAVETGRRGISPNAVADVVERALLARVPRTRYLVGRDAQFRAVLSRIVPDRVRDRLIARAMRLPTTEAT